MLTREELKHIYVRLIQSLKEAPAPREGGYGFMISSGTSGKGPMLSVHALDEHVVLWLHDVPGTRRIQACAPRTLRPSYFVSMQCIAQARQEMFLDPVDFTPELSPLLTDYAPDCLFGPPSFMMRLRGYMDQKTAEGVRHIRLIGEYVTADMRANLGKAFPSALFKNVYMSTDTTTIGMSQCEHLPLNQYHAAPRVSVRIHEPDNEGIGEIVVSKHMNPGTPIEWNLEEYNIGDAGRLLPERCLCGKPILQVFGRSGFDYIKLLGAIFRQEECDRVASLYSEAYSEYRLEASEVSEGDVVKGKIHMRFAGARALSSQEVLSLVQKFSEELFVTPTQTLRQLIEQGIFLPPTGSFEPNGFPVTAKMVRLSYIPS